MLYLEQCTSILYVVKQYSYMLVTIYISTYILNRSITVFSTFVCMQYAVRAGFHIAAGTCAVFDAHRTVPPRRI